MAEHDDREVMRRYWRDNPDLHPFFVELSRLVSLNAPRNFGREFTPEDLYIHFTYDLRWSWVRALRDELVAVVTLSREGELGFVANPKYATMGALFCMRTLDDILMDRPLPGRYWAYVQPDNRTVRRALTTRGFVEGDNNVFWSDPPGTAGRTVPAEV